MRKIDKIIIHCTATVEGEDFRAADIERWHQAQGFRTIGYHYVVLLDGSVEKGRADESVGAHVRGLNAHSIGVVYVGGLDIHREPSDTRTNAQRVSLRHLVGELQHLYPGATVHGHNEFANKACPCFDVQEEVMRGEL